MKVPSSWLFRSSNFPEASAPARKRNRFASPFRGMADDCRDRLGRQNDQERAWRAGGPSPQWWVHAPIEMFHVVRVLREFIADRVRAYRRFARNKAEARSLVVGRDAKVSSEIVRQWITVLATILPAAIDGTGPDPTTNVI